MTLQFKRVLAAAAALAIAAPFGVQALVPADSAVHQQEPKDCKAKPEDPRCKDDKKY